MGECMPMDGWLQGWLAGRMSGTSLLPRCWYPMVWREAGLEDTLRDDNTEV